MIADHLIRKLRKKQMDICDSDGLLPDILEPRTMIAVPVHGLGPHGCGTDPKPAFAVKGAIDYHRLQCFRVAGKSDQFVFVAFKVTIFSGL
jgi:hypothetical protein